MKKGHLVFVLRPETDCSHGGVSSLHDHLLLVTDGGHLDIAATDPRLYLTQYMGRTIAVPFEPDVDARGNCCLHGHMFGGNFLWSSDSRFREHVGDHPVPVFDRNESMPYWLSFPGNDLVALRNAATLLDEVYAQLSTDSDLEAVAAAWKYQYLLDRMRVALSDLNSSQTPIGHKLMAEKRLRENTYAPGTGSEVYRGYFGFEGSTIDIEFAVRKGASQMEKDAAFLAALAQQADVDYAAVTRQKEGFL